MTFGLNSQKFGYLRQVDFIALLGSLVCLFLLVADVPWWTLSGATSPNLLGIQVSPYYLRTAASGLPSSIPFAGPLGYLTRGLMILGFLCLAGASLRPGAWWHDLALYSGMSVIAELFLSFLLMLHGAEVTLVGAYGSLPTFSGTGQLSGSIVGLDLTSHIEPLVSAGFGFPLYLGLVCGGLVGSSLVVGMRRERRRQMGIAAIFTRERETRS